MESAADAASVSRSLSPQDAEMRDQLHILQEREMLLSQKLALEREKRLHAERVTETQRQACMELHLLLDKERRRSGCYSKVPESKLLRKHKTPCVAEEGANGVPGKEEQDGDHEHSAVGNGVSTGSGSDGAGEEGVEPLPSLAARGSLSDEVFSNLPEDLQELLRSASSFSKIVKPTGKQALFDAAICGDAASLESQLKRVAVADSIKTQNNSTLTHIVAARGYQDCLQVLLEAGADPNSLGPALSTPVILAAAEGHHKCLRLLTAAGGCTTHRDAEGCDVLYRAALGGHDKCVQVLLDGGMESFGANNFGQTAVHAAVQSQSTSCLRILLTHLRAHHSESTVARLLCSQDHNGQSVVHYAAGSGVKACLEILLPSPELDLELRDRWNRTALDVATADCRELLISRDFREVLLVVSLANNHKGGSEEEGEGDFIVVGRVHVLRHHKWSDVDFLVEDSLAGYCSMLKGHPRAQGGCVVRPGAGEGEQGNGNGKEDEAGRRGQQGRKHTSEVLDDFYSSVAGLSLSPHPVQSYRVGQVTWKWGEAPRGGQPRGPFALFAPKEGEPFDARPELVLTLTGTAQESVDDIALSTLYSSSVLSSYIDLVHKHKNVIIHGPSGSGKTYLARHMAECLKTRQDLVRAEVVRAVMHPGFKREDLLRLLHFTGALVPVLAPPAEREGELTVPREEEGSSMPPSPSNVSPRPSVTSMHAMSHSVIIILDDIDRISLPEVLGELAGLLDKRGPQHAVWVGPTHGRGGAEESHPPKCYYLREDVFFVATINKKSGSDLDQFTHDRFKHVWLSPDKEPTAGLLLRHLMRKAIHANKGRLPARSSQFYRTLQWVCDVWCLLNHYLTRMGLIEARIGPRHFFSCPVEGGFSEAITQWMVELWNTQLVPLIRDVSVYSHPAGGAERVDVCAQVLTTLTQRAFRPTAPMDPRATLRFLVQLDGGEEGLAMVAEARRKAKGTKSPVMSYFDLKDDRSSVPIQRTCSVGSLPHHSVGSTPSHTPQGTPGVPRRETFAGTNTKVSKTSTNSSPPEGEAPGKKTNSLPVNTPPPTRKEWKDVSSPEKEKKRKRKSIGRMFGKKKPEEEETLRDSSPNLTVGDGQEQEPVKKKPNELDDIVDLVFYLTADRLNEQRSPLPALRSIPQPAGDMTGLDPSPLAHSTTSTTTVERRHSSEQTSSQQNSSTDTSVFSAKEGGGVTPIRSRNCSPNVSAKTNSSLALSGPKGVEEDKVAGIR